MQRRFEFCKNPCAKALVALVALVATAAIEFAVPIEAMATEANAMQIVVGNGPVAGTYRIRPYDVNCVSTANGIAASFKFVGIPSKEKPHVSNLRVSSAEALSEAQVVVDNPTDREPKHGSLALTFGNRGEHPVKYLVFVPGGGTLVQTAAGPGLAFAFKGRTKDGIALEASAICRDTMKL